MNSNKVFLERQAIVYISRHLTIRQVSNLLAFWRFMYSRFSCDVVVTTFPSEVLVASDERSCRNLTFDDVLARQGSSFCCKARLNFQAFSLRDMKWWQEKVVA